jgi:hypothetical protein
MKDVEASFGADVQEVVYRLQAAGFSRIRVPVHQSPVKQVFVESHDPEPITNRIRHKHIKEVFGVDEGTVLKMV